MPSPHPKGSAEKQFSMAKHIPYELKAARGPLAVALQLGGLRGLLLMALCRERQGLYSTLCEAQELQSILKWCMFQIEKAEREAKAGEPSLAERAEESHARIVERAKRERERQERRHLERCAGRPSGNPAVIKSECRVIRPAAVVADRVLVELSSQGSSPEAEVESTPEVEERSSTPKGNYSRKRIGECGMRIGSNIDMVLRQIRGPQIEDESTWEEPEFPYELANSILEEIRFSSVREPSKPLGAGAQGTDDTVAGRGSSDFTIPESGLSLEVKAKAPSAISEFDTSVWAKLTQPDCGTDCGSLEGLIDALDSSPELRSAALLRSMGRYRDVLDALPSDAPIDTPLTVTAVDVLVLIKTVMSRLR